MGICCLMSPCSDGRLYLDDWHGRVGRRDRCTLQFGVRDGRFLGVIEEGIFIFGSSSPALSRWLDQALGFQFIVEMPRHSLTSSGNFVGSPALGVIVVAAWFLVLGSSCTVITRGFVSIAPNLTRPALYTCYINSLASLSLCRIRLVLGQLDARSFPPRFPRFTGGWWKFRGLASRFMSNSGQ